MKGEIRSPLTRNKERYRAVFQALHSEAKHYHGGISGLAQMLGKNPITLANKLNPHNLEQEPTLGDFLSIIDLTSAKRAANAVAMLAGTVAVEVSAILSESHPRDVFGAFMVLVKEAGDVNHTTAEALEDGGLDYVERNEVADLLDNLIAAAVAMRAVVRG